MRKAHLAGTLASLLLFSGTLGAGTILTWHEEGTRQEKGTQKTRPWHGEYTARSSDLGLRVDGIETTDTPENISIVYVRRTRTVHLIVSGRPEPITIDDRALAALQQKAAAQGRPRRAGRFTVTPIGSEHTLNGFTCKGFTARKPAEPSRFLCLADPTALGIDDETRANFRELGALMTPFSDALRRLKPRGEDDAPEPLDTYGLAEGFPVREFLSRAGVVRTDFQLVSVAKGDVPPSLFEIASAKKARSGPLVPSPDHSLSPEAYIARGLPAHDRDWSAEDYAQAASVLKSLVEHDPTALPRYESGASGAVFQRITAPGNLAILNAKSPPLQQRILLLASLVQNLGEVIGVYFAATAKGQFLDTEIVELLAYLIDAAAEMARKTEDFIAKLPPDDPDRDQRLKGRREMKEGLATSASGAIEMLGEHEAYRTSELVRLAKRLEASLPRLRPFLPPGTQQELPGRLQRMIDAEADPALKEQLQRIAAALGKGRATP